MLHEFLKRGWLGEPFEVHTVMSKVIAPGSRPGLAEYPGGIMFELGCHIIDLVIGVLGAPERVTPYKQHASASRRQAGRQHAGRARISPGHRHGEVERAGSRGLCPAALRRLRHRRDVSHPAARRSVGSRGAVASSGASIAGVIRTSRFPSSPVTWPTRPTWRRSSAAKSRRDFPYEHDLAVQTTLLEACGCPWSESPCQGAEPTADASFWNASTQAAAVTAAAATLGGVHALAAEKPANRAAGHHRLRRHHEPSTSRGWSTAQKTSRSPGCATSIRGRSTRWPASSRAFNRRRRSRRRVRRRDRRSPTSTPASSPRRITGTRRLRWPRCRQGQRRLHREADFARLRRRAAGHRRGQEVRPRGAAGEPDASSPVTKKAGKLLGEGIIGEDESRPGLDGRSCASEAEPLPDGTPPAGVDYDRWLGPAPRARVQSAPVSRHVADVSRLWQRRDRRRRHSRSRHGRLGTGHRHAAASRSRPAAAE